MNSIKYSLKDVDVLKDLFGQYLNHRLLATIPHLTFKRFLVSRNRRDMCDLYDAIRRCRYSSSILKVPFVSTVEIQVDLIHPHFESVSRDCPRCSWSYSSSARYKLGID